MIVSDLFTLMTVLNNELDTSAGGSDESRSVNALNLARYYCQTVAASLPRVLVTSAQPGTDPDKGTIRTAGLREWSPIPPELLRIDKLWLLDVSTRLPIRKLVRVDEIGGHAPSLPWPIYYVLSSAGSINGMPAAYEVNEGLLWWEPIPDVAYEVRAYGLWSRPLFVDRNSAVLFPEVLAEPLAAFAVKYGLVGIGDATDEMQKIATEAFTPALRSLRRKDRSRPASRHYEYVHTT